METEFHCVMTIQSIWNRQPGAAVTYTTLVSGQTVRTAAELYAIVHAEALDAWGKTNYQTSLGEPVVLHWSFTPNTL